MDGFTFFKSYYESAHHLSDADQALFYKCIMDYMFTGKEPQVEGHLMGFWLLVKPNLDTSKNRAKAGQKKSKPNQKRIKPKSKPKPSPLEDKERDKDKDKDMELDTRLNATAFKEWCDYKGSKFKAVSKTKATNLLVKHDKHTQRKMIDASIANGWAGLFEPKQQTSSNGKEPEVGSIAWRMQQEQGIIDVSA